MEGLDAGDPEWEQEVFEKAVSGCVTQILAEKMRNGGLEMDWESGHATAFDRFWEECSKKLGVGKEH